MKSLVFCVAMVFAVFGVHAQGVVLPSDTAVHEPAEVIPAAVKAFSGRWEGKWDERMPHVLVVEEIKSATEATVLYAWQAPPAANAWNAGWARFTATIDGNILRVPLSEGKKAWYELQADGSLKASYTRPNSSSQSNAVLRKVQP
ncbi:hypothetical protein [Rhodoferax fermentans]|nr:hypothetical protein [Rhodoferax fermentans]